MIPVELGAPAFLLLLTLGAIFGLVSVWTFRRWVDGAKLHVAISAVLAHLLEFHLFAAEPALLFKAQRDLVLSNLRVLRLIAIPSLVLMIPFCLFFTVEEGLFARAPLQVGQAAVVTVQYSGQDASWRMVHLQAPSGLDIEAGPIRVAHDSVVSWRIRAHQPVAGSLNFITRGNIVSKSVQAESGSHWISPNRLRFPHVLLQPLESPLTDSSVQAISISYPSTTVFHAWPLLWFGIGSCVGSIFYVLLGRFSTHRHVLLAASFFLASSLHGQAASPLFARGFAVLPQPQEVSLQPDEISLDSSNWRLQADPSVPADSIAVESLIEGLRERDGIQLSQSAISSFTLHLEIKPGSIQPGALRDPDRKSIESQAYRLVLNQSGVQITANAAEGLFYGVQTLLQLVSPSKTKFRLPHAEITDWPDLARRQIYWDDAHHLNRMVDMEAAIRQAAFFKINGLVIKFEGHFQYRSASALVEPQALSPEQLQHLTDYGLRRHVQVIPYLDSPAHIAFILKHPEYAKLRAFPDSNYELCTTNPAALQFLYGMFDDLLAANRGVRDFYLSTDESYYIGLAANSSCDEATRAKQLGSRGKLLAEFVRKAADYLHQRGREVIFWGEYPLKPTDISSLPDFVINGETNGPAVDPIYRSHGIRQMVYDAVQGEEMLFPHYFMLPASKRIHPTYEDFPRVEKALGNIATTERQNHAQLTGLIVAAWGDMGLHEETFWLGYATVTSSGWRSFSGGAQEAISCFYDLWYGADARNMNRLYQLMSFQAQIWADTWDKADSTDRVGIWGNSEEVYHERRPAYDATLPLPPIPREGLMYQSDWQERNARRLTVASDALPENDELLGLLDENLLRVRRHRYGLQVFQSVARLCRQNLEFLAGWKHVDDLLANSSDKAHQDQPGAAVQLADEALDTVIAMKNSRNRVMSNVTTLWYQSWLPRVSEANGRKFLHQVDDVKDHLPDRTVDLSYLVQREMLLHVDEWFQRTQAARNAYALVHHLPARKSELVWALQD